jgi:hypothetical protein
MEIVRQHGDCSAAWRLFGSMEIVRTLIAFAVIPDLKAPIPPEWPMYSKFRHNQDPCLKEILQLMQPCLIPYPGDERSDPKSKLYYRQRADLQVKEQEYLQHQQKHARILAEYLLEQWPCAEPNLGEFLTAPFLVNTGILLEVIQPEWLRLFQNMELSSYISQMQRILDQYQLEDGQVSVPPPTGNNLQHDCYPTPMYNLLHWPTLLDFLSMTVPESLRHEISSTESHGPVEIVAYQSSIPKQLKAEHSITIPGLRDLVAAQSSMPVFSSPQQELSSTPTPVAEIQVLETTVTTFAQSPSLVRQQYSEDLFHSLLALRQYQDSPQQHSEQINPAKLSSLISQSEEEIELRLDKLRQLFTARDPQRAYWLQQAELWPSVKAVSLLESLRSIVRGEFGKGMKEFLIAYACAITKLQRLLRIQEAQQKNNKQKVIEEYDNIGHSNWSPLDRPDWILFEIDANMLIRPGQVDVAMATISPTSKSNSVLQMNMGQGMLNSRTW